MVESSSKNMKKEKKSDREDMNISYNPIIKPLILYPRTCEECGGIYSSKFTFSKHKTKGTCLKMQIRKEFNADDENILKRQKENVNKQKKYQNENKNKLSVKERKIEIKNRIYDKHVRRQKKKVNKRKANLIENKNKSSIKKWKTEVKNRSYDKNVLERRNMYDLWSKEDCNLHHKTEIIREKINKQVTKLSCSNRQVFELSSSPSNEFQNLCGDENCEENVVFLGEGDICDFQSKEERIIQHKDIAKQNNNNPNGQNFGFSNRARNESKNSSGDKNYEENVEFLGEGDMRDLQSTKDKTVQLNYVTKQNCPNGQDFEFSTSASNEFQNSSGDENCEENMELLVCPICLNIFESESGFQNHRTFCFTKWEKDIDNANDLSVESEIECIDQRTNQDEVSKSEHLYPTYLQTLKHKNDYQRHSQEHKSRREEIGVSKLETQTVLSSSQPDTNNKLSSERLKCPVCCRVFQKNICFQKHLEKCWQADEINTAKLTEDHSYSNKKRKNKKDFLICNECSTFYVSKTSFSAHKNKDLCKKNLNRISCTYSECYFKFTRYEHLIEHLPVFHNDNTFLSKTKYFNNFEDFINWKSKEHNERFVYLVKTRGTRRYKNIEYNYYECQFNAVNDKKRGPERKTGRRKKAGLIPHLDCPARITVSKNIITGKVEVNYMETHSHDLSSDHFKYQRFPKSVNNDIISRLKKGYTPHQILESYLQRSDKFNKTNFCLTQLMNLSYIKNLRSQLVLQGKMEGKKKRNMKDTESRERITQYSESEILNTSFEENANGSSTQTMIANGKDLEILVVYPDDTIHDEQLVYVEKNELESLDVEDGLVHEEEFTNEEDFSIRCKYVQLSGANLHSLPNEIVS